MLTLTQLILQVKIKKAIDTPVCLLHFESSVKSPILQGFSPHWKAKIL